MAGWPVKGAHYKAERYRDVENILTAPARTLEKPLESRFSRGHSRYRLPAAADRRDGCSLNPTLLSGAARRMLAPPFVSP
jgi:hypothetical protein